MMGLLKKETMKIEARGVTGVTVKELIDAEFGVVGSEA